MHLTDQQYDDLNQQLAEVEMDKSLNTEYVDLEGYWVAELTAKADANVECGNCGLKWAVSDLMAIGSCALTAGDPSPVGRCPECQALAYIEDPLHDAVSDLMKALYDIVDMAKYLAEPEICLRAEAAIKKATQTI